MLKTSALKKSASKTPALKKKNIVIGFVGTKLDQARQKANGTSKQKWRPTLSLFDHDELPIDGLVLIYDPHHQELFDALSDEIATLSPKTTLIGKQISIEDPWDFAQMYGKLYDFTHEFDFDTDHNNYYLHITTGTHVAQICWFLLIDAHYLPAQILQTAPDKHNKKSKYRIIDLDLSRYDALTSRFAKEEAKHWQALQSNIASYNADFNHLINQVQKVATRSTAPILIMGATGVGKSKLAKQIFTLKKQIFQLTGNFVDVNCATLKGDSAMSALFGHIKGAFTGATSSRTGYLKSADGGLLFLDEIGELGADEQAMLLKALEDKSFFAVGADTPTLANFQLIAGTNKDLRAEVAAGNFREDLWARLNTWTFFLPSLNKRREDIAPNIAFELSCFATLHQQNIHFAKDAYADYLAFAKSDDAIWQGNFRDLSASINRMATLCPKNCIDKATVADEIATLKQLWQVSSPTAPNEHLLATFFSQSDLDALDEFDKIQLAGVIGVCQKSHSLAEAGRTLFAHSRTQKKSSNDSDRLKKYLAKFGLTWEQVGGFG